MKNVVFSIVITTGLLLGGCTILGWQIPATNVVVQKAPVNNETDQKQSVNNKLDLSSQQLKKIPDDVFNDINLEELDISNNQIGDAIQSQIVNLKTLRCLRRITIL
jgi:Leucine-rich repeat (LRR) protein